MKRRDFLTLSVKAAMAAGFTGAIPASLLKTHTAHAAILSAGLSDPAAQPLFVNPVPNALSAGFKYVPKANKLRIIAGQAVQMTGLVGADGVTPVPTTIWGYGENGAGVTWPGKTIERHVNDKPLDITWQNKLNDAAGNPLTHLLPVDTSLHWAYALHGESSINGVDYRQYSLEQDGVPLVPHVHGGRNDSSVDGNPEYFFSPGYGVRGPRWQRKRYRYGGSDWNNTAGMMWYHDHALGITRLNVYAGLAGFFPLRDDNDTGIAGNPAGLPADPYELGFAVQDRMFTSDGELFMPAYPGDPSYEGFITGEGAILPPEMFPGGGPTALAEFFGDHMLVNGIIWPKYSVEKRQYRVRFLNGCDSRFMRLRLKVVAAGEADQTNGTIVPFYIIGSDQSMRATAAEVNEVDFLPGERLDLVIDFKNVPDGSRVIVENLYGDSPFGGDLPDPDPAVEDVFWDRRTDRVMAFDVELATSNVPDTYIMAGSTLLGGGVAVSSDITRTRKLALFEGMDEFGRLQPLLGTAEPVVDVAGNTVTGAMPWHTPITENPDVGDTEIWEIYNATGDAHPVHVHLVHFEVINREGFTADSIEQPVIQHNGAVGVAQRLENIVADGNTRGPGASEETRRDMVMALPGEITRIKMTFDKAGRYVWHCHILSHEDHEMMRPYHVGPGPF